MIDTSALTAALIADHEHHAIARPHLSRSTVIPAIVLAETYSVLRRAFAQPAPVATALLAPWTGDSAKIAATSAATVSAVFARAVELDLGGNVHDALVAETCRTAGMPLVTLDRRQHTVALAFGADSTLLLPPT